MSKSDYQISGSWDDITLVCGNGHRDEIVQMRIQEGPSSLFYACPKHAKENRREGEALCNNRLNLVDFTTMLQHLHNLIGEAEENDSTINLTAYHWKDKKGTEFRVLKHNGDKMTIQVKNNRAIKT